MYNEIASVFYKNIYIFLRCFGFFVTAPFFSFFNSSNKTVRMIMAMSFSFFVSQTNCFAQKSPDIFIMCKEFLFGMILGFIIKIGFEIFNFMGAIIGYQSGFSMHLLADPSGESSNIYSSLFLLLGACVFFGVNGHIYALNFLYKSFELLPAESFFKIESLKNVLSFSRDFFVFGLKFSLPLVVALFITEICLGIFSKILPGINFMIIGQPLRMLASFALVAVYVGFFGAISENVFDLIFSKLNLFLSSL